MAPNDSIVGKIGGNGIDVNGVQAHLVFNV